MKSGSDRNRAAEVHGTAGPMSPQNPYIGDGKTRRDPHDRVESVERTEDGKRRRR